MDQLKISYEGLDNDEKDLFLDITCFFRGKEKDEATRKLDACGFNPGIGITVLIQKALLNISSNGCFDMHDLVQEMGHDIVRGEHPNNPEKHSRVWKKNEIASMFSGNALTENDKIEAIQYVCADQRCDCLPGFIKLVSNMKKLRFLDVNIHRLHSYDEGPESSDDEGPESSHDEEPENSYDEEPENNYDEGPAFLSNELKYIRWSWYAASPFPESFKATKLVVLKLHHSLQKEFWKGCKHLPCLKELEVNNARHLVRTPDFGGLPCLQKLTLHRCHILEDIDPSPGNHSRLAYVCVSSCDKLTRFPTIVWMKKLEALVISECHSLCEFPGIEANMDSLVYLCLNRIGIEVLPSSVGRCCTNLISLQLKNCTNLKYIDGNFRSLKRLLKFEFASLITQLKWLPKDLFDEKCCLEELCFDLEYWGSNMEYWGLNRLLLSPLRLPRLLRKLNLSGLRLKDGGIPFEIGELSNLQELRLCRNYFSRLNFSLFELTRLKLLNLSGCRNLVELPELGSNLAILQADNCHSLEAIRDDVNRNCKWLCQVSITKSYLTESYGLCSFVGGERLLETMLQGKAQCMSMKLKGLEIPKGFKPRLVKQTRCRLKLPENWFNDFSGFLFCGVWMKNSSYDSVKITMRQEEKHQQLQMGMTDSQDEQVFWEEESVVFPFWMGYVSFESLRCTTWWDITSTAVDVSIDLYPRGELFISGFGARLVSRKNQMEETTTTNNSYAHDDYKCKFKILHDSRSCFDCVFIPL